LPSDRGGAQREQQNDRDERARVARAERRLAEVEAGPLGLQRAGGVDAKDDRLVERHAVHGGVAGEGVGAPGRHERHARRDASSDQQRQEVLRQRARDGGRDLRVDRRRGEVDGEGDRRERADQRARPRVEQRQAPERNERDEIPSADAVAARPAVERDVEADEDDRQRGDGELRAAFRPAEQPDDGHQQDWREEKVPAVRGQRDVVEDVERRHLQHAERRAVRQESWVGLGHAGGEEAAEADPLVDRDGGEGDDGAGGEALPAIARKREKKNRRRAEVVHRCRQPRREPRQRAPLADQRIEQQCGAGHGGHEDRGVRQQLRPERHHRRHERRPSSLHPAAPRVREEHGRDQRAGQRHAEQRAEVDVEGQRGVGVGFDGVQRGVWQRRDPGERRRLVGVDVAVRIRDVAGVAGVGVDGEGVALDDGARQVELRILVPAAAGEKVGVGGEGQQREPRRDAAVVEVTGTFG